VKPATPMIGVLLLALVATTGCDMRWLPGAPQEEDRWVPDSELMTWEYIYVSQCSGCHGADGTLGGARPLNDAVYLASVPAATLRSIIESGIDDTLMPGFLDTNGGRLTPAQITGLLDQLQSNWGNGEPTPGLPPWSSPTSGDVQRGQARFATACGTCHGPTGSGGPQGGSVIDPTFLSLVSDQSLRSTILYGRTDLGMAGAMTVDPAAPLTDQDVADIVAYLVSHRVPYPGQLYPTTTPGTP